MGKLYIFPDTNLLLHFTRPDQVDWKAVCQESDVVIVLAPIVVREIERHKDHPQSKRLRQRARNISEWLRAIRRTKTPLPNGAALEVATKEPKGSFGDDLDGDVWDDRLIASALAYRSEGRAVAVATDDTLLLHKLDAHEIRAIELPLALRRKEEPDEVEAENISLKKQLEVFAKRAPKLLVTWKGGLTAHEIRLPKCHISALSTPQTMRSQYPKLANRSERTAVPGGENFMRLSAMMAAPDDKIAAYNAKLELFYSRYDAYYKAAVAFAEWKRLLQFFEFEIRNVGNAVANGIVIEVRVPEEFFLIEGDNFDGPEVPKQPNPPRPPGGLGLVLHEAEARPSIDFARHLNLPAVYLGPEVDTNARKATFHERRLLHGITVELHEVGCLVHPVAHERPITLEVTVHAEELLGPLQQQLTLSVVVEI